VELENLSGLNVVATVVEACEVTTIEMVVDSVVVVMLSVT
jgi:hypothetical protein